jgi:Oxidoreductase family, NAD-binding Rossmann fold
VETEPARYLVVGRGRWAQRIEAILSGEDRAFVSLEESRRAASEGGPTYRQRLLTTFKTSGAQIAWLCVPPGNHIPVMMSAAIEAGLHVIVEKPWLCSPMETQRLQALANAHHALLAIHYEYCLLDAVTAWRREYKAKSGLRFGGRLKVQRPNHIGLPALDNLGSHLFSIHEYCVPEALITGIDCAYEQPDERRVWLEKENWRVAEIDLLANKEPIIQRFIAGVEASTRGGDFPLNLQFALRVAERTALWRRQEPQG